MVSLVIPSLGHIKVWLLIKFLISFKVAYSQACLKYYGSLVTSAKFLGSGMKCDTSDPDYPKVNNELFHSFTTSLKTLCKPLHMLFAGISDPFHSLCVFLILPRIFILASIALMS